MSHYCVQYSPAAYEDLRAVYRYIALELQAEETAQHQTTRIRRAVRTLDRFPHRHPTVDWEPWMSMGVHKVPVDNYYVFYCVDEKMQTVTILRIFYAGRDIENIIK